ncbi:MAG: type II toxin-antitoxin system RelB family antitoxin [Rhizobiaceae bacterium]
MLAIRLSPELEARLEALAKRTGRTKTYYAREAIEQHLEDLEDLYDVEKRYEDALDNGEKSYTLDEVERELGLAD